MVTWKVLWPDGRCYWGGHGSWPLPRGREPGEWLHVKGTLSECRRGLHLCRTRDLVEWIGPAIFEAEIDTGAGVLVAADMLVARRARLVRRTSWCSRIASMWAVECVERALPIWESEFRTERNLRAVVEAARAACLLYDDANVTVARAMLREAARRCDDSRPAPFQVLLAAEAALDAAATARRSPEYLSTIAASSAAEAACAAVGYRAVRRTRSRSAHERARVWSEAHARERDWQTARLLELLGEPTVRAES